MTGAPTRPSPEGVDVEALIAAAEERGRQESAHFQPDHFRTLVRAVPYMVRRCRADPGLEPLVRANLDLAVAALASGQVPPDLERIADLRFSSPLVALLLAVPIRIPEIPPARRLTVLAEAWNLAQGLSREPAWVQRVALGGLGTIDLAGFRQQLVAVLAPVLRERPPSSFGGPTSVETLDCAPVDPRFLPGEIRAAASGVVCVEDRRTPGRCVSVLLEPAASRVLPGTEPLPVAHPQGKVPDLRLEPNAVWVQGTRTVLPHLAHPHTMLALPSGFVVVSALDSQRLWVVHCP